MIFIERHNFFLDATLCCSFWPIASSRMCDGGHALSEGVNAVCSGDQLHVFWVDGLKAEGSVNIIEGGQQPGRNLCSFAFQGVHKAISYCYNTRPRACVVDGKPYGATSYLTTNQVHI